LSFEIGAYSIASHIRSRVYDASFASMCRPCVEAIELSTQGDALAHHEETTLAVDKSLPCDVRAIITRLKTIQGLDRSDLSGQVNEAPYTPVGCEHGRAKICLVSPVLHSYRISSAFTKPLLDLENAPHLGDARLQPWPTPVPRS
jgi:hypothetical protein